MYITRPPKTLIVDHPDLETHVRRLAKKQGETLTQAVLTAVEEREARLAKLKLTLEERDAIVQAVIAHARVEPLLDNRTADEVIGYNKMDVPE